MGNFFNNLGNAFGGIFLGILLFFGSFFVVFQNEGRTNYREVAETAVPIEQTNSPDSLVYLTDKVTSTENISDGQYIKAGPYLYLQRIVEMYSWREDKETKTDKDNNSTDTFTYKKVWTGSPSDSSTFATQAGHENPGLSISESNALVETASIGAYSLKPNALKLPPTKKVALSNEKVNIITGSGSTMSGSGMILVDNYIYVGSGSLMKPEIGDTRISFGAVYNGIKGTIFGKKVGNELLPHHDPKMKEVYRIFEGDRSDALTTLQQEYSFQLWMWRGIGFFVLWMSLLMVLKPLTLILDVVPVLGKFANGAISFVTFLIALVLTIVTSLVSIVLHNVLGLIAVAIISFAICYFALFRKRSASVVTK